MKEGMNRIKRAPLKRTLIFTLILTLLLSGSVFARYTTNYRASDSIEVAPLDIEFSVVKAVGTNGASVTGNMTSGFTMTLTDMGQKITFELKVTNKSRVNTICTPSLTNITGGTTSILNDLNIATRLLAYNAKGEPIAVSSVSLKAAVFNANGTIKEATSTTVFLEIDSIPTNTDLSILGTFNIVIDVKQAK